MPQVRRYCAITLTGSLRHVARRRSDEHRSQFIAQQRSHTCDKIQRTELQRQLKEYFVFLTALEPYRSQWTTSLDPALSCAAAPILLHLNLKPAALLPTYLSPSLFSDVFGFSCDLLTWALMLSHAAQNRSDGGSRLALSTITGAMDVTAGHASDYHHRAAAILPNDANRTTQSACIHSIHRHLITQTPLASICCATSCATSLQQIDNELYACASISLHGWGTQWPINSPHYCPPLIHLHSPPPRNGVRSHSRCGTES